MPGYQFGKFIPQFGSWQMHAMQTHRIQTSFLTAEFQLHTVSENGLQYPPLAS
jgi:hypothetical protein